MRLPRLFRPDPSAAPAHALYFEVVRQSRLPAFYLEGGVPDSLDGRFDLIALHAFLAMRRLKREGQAGQNLAQALFDIMFADMDQSLREMGVGDLGVGRRVKAMASAFYGRIAAYDAGLERDDAALGDALARNLYGTTDPSPAVLSRMVAYVRQQAADSDDWPSSSLLGGQIRFAPPVSAG
jgi:cytochrome b pre-mRNA-processing protein 3